MQKVYFDQMWDRSLTEILDTLKDSQPPESDFKALAARLNEGNAGHASEIQSFKQAYEREIEGVLSLSADLKNHDPQHFSFFMQSFRETPKMQSCYLRYISMRAVMRQCAGIKRRG